MEKNTKLFKTVKPVTTKDFIVCPHCQAEFHPSEIFDPKYLLGIPDGIVKDPLGKIIWDSNDGEQILKYREDNEPLTAETYTCDYCGKAFNISATISYTTAPIAEEEDFSDLSSNLLK